ncbi:MAG TPA: hypothetical protein VMD77_06580 [Candidatus Baltobacteraceae bacterium]|jgi:hypothetical protein|nr:hypothetical protein [Candidatus Baltobacteraceae bacterium]
MPPDAETRIEFARTASGDELKSLIHEASEDALLALLENPKLDQAHVTQLLERLDLPANVLGAIGSDGKWTTSESIRLGLARHPRTPKRVALAVVRQLYLFDLVRLSLLPSTPADIKRVAEEIIISRVPHIPVGQKLTLARRGPSRVAGALLAEGHAQAVKLALANAFMTESQVLKVLAKPGVPERVVAAIAQDAKWSRQYNIRAALVRNPHTPSARVLEFLPDLTLRDLKDISELEELAPRLKKQISDEIALRAAGGEPRGR